MRYLQKNFLQKTLVVLLLQITLFVGSAFGFTGAIQAHATPAITPEANRYQTNQTTNQANIDLKNAQYEAEKSAERLKNNDEPLSEKVADKLNLNEPLPEDTKKFFRQIKGEERVYDSETMNR